MKEIAKFLIAENKTFDEINKLTTSSRYLVHTQHPKFIGRIDSEGFLPVVYGSEDVDELLITEAVKFIAEYPKK